MNLLNPLRIASLSLLISGSTVAADPPRPNIILIMSDDMGFSDVGCYGGEIDTPNLNRMAANGLRYTQFDCQGNCFGGEGR